MWVIHKEYHNIYQQGISMVCVCVAGGGAMCEHWSVTVRCFTKAQKLAPALTPVNLTSKLRRHSNTGVQTNDVCRGVCGGGFMCDISHRALWKLGRWVYIYVPALAEETSCGDDKMLLELNPEIILICMICQCCVCSISVCLCNSTVYIQERKSVYTVLWAEWLSKKL